MIYSAINIGPIGKTLGMARKPRELWAASYMFSELMRNIMKVINNDKTISPALARNEINVAVGIYPDRVYFEGEIDKAAIDKAVEEYARNLCISQDYFNVMCTTVEVPVEKDVIKTLNEKLDKLELFNRAIDSDIEKDVYNFIKGEDSSRFKKVFGKIIDIESLGDIAKSCDKRDKSIKDYICIVQADGDNMGKIMKNCPKSKAKEISQALINFGQEACKTISEYSNCNLPIYAGGDDLLFIVPVVGGKSKLNIFELIDKIDEHYQKVSDVASGIKDENGKEIATTMSYGIAISYHKYPLYEARESAYNMLQKAKDSGRNAIAWDLRKHSGGAFTGCLKKNESTIKEAFEKIIEFSPDSETVVSAVSHKIRENQGLLELWVNDKDLYQLRNESFFKMFMENTGEDEYKKAALNLLNALFEKNDNVDTIVENMYGMLRTAKFVKGEPEHD